MSNVERKKKKVEWMLEDIIDEMASNGDRDELQEALSIIKDAYVYDRI